MKRFSMILLTLTLILPIFFVQSANASYDPSQVLRVGLIHGSSASTGANIFYDGNLKFGYYSSDYKTFTSLYDSSARFISVTKDVNLSISGNKVSEGAGQIGAYHVQVAHGYGSYLELSEIENSIRALGITQNTFPAYVNGSFYLRIGNFSSKASAEAEMSKLSGLGYNVSVVGGNTNTLTVIDMNNLVVLFEFESSSMGLAIEGISSGERPQLKNGTTNYYGGFECRRSGDNANVTLINVIDVETYLKCVVPYEMSPTWPIEALKAQAVAARNYAYSNLNKHRALGFDLCASVDCQAYYGTGGMSALSNRAVDETAGVLLTYQGKIAETYYHSSSGGYTENSENVWTTAIPYLVAVESPYEDLDKAINGRWSYSVTPRELTDHFISKGYDIGLIKDIYVSKYTDAGNVYSVTVVDVNGKSFTISKETMRIRLSPYVKSHAFTISSGNSGVSVNNEGNRDYNGLYVIDGNENKTPVPLSPNSRVISKDGTTSLNVNESSGSAFVFTGRGWGNNVGMSQWSAKGMAENGYTYDKILTHFFKGTEVTRLS